MRKRVPTHPGAILREDVLPGLPGMSVSAFARSLGVSRQTLHAVLAERSGVPIQRARQKSGSTTQRLLDHALKSPHVFLDSVSMLRQGSQSRYKHSP